MVQWVKNPPAVQETCRFDPWVGSGRPPGGGTSRLRSKGSQRVSHDWATKHTALHYWRGKCPRQCRRAIPLCCVWVKDCSQFLDFSVPGGQTQCPLLLSRILVFLASALPHPAPGGTSASPVNDSCSEPAVSRVCPNEGSSGRRAQWAWVYSRQQNKLEGCLSSTVQANSSHHFWVRIWPICEKLEFSWVYLMVSESLYVLWATDIYK